ncbi:MAG: kynureninase [SAR324 cluster bacterium]|nr:kynureninase [SAR324 cluster bacterium]MBL7034235.1 kynureninase [SAR324 cluster bacterium]
MRTHINNLLESRTACEQEDIADPLYHWQDEFQLPQDLIYLDGNSLGPLPKRALKYLEQAIQKEWAEDLITSWNRAGWWNLPETLGEFIAPLIGAASGQVIVSDSTSLNIYKAVHAALRLRPERTVIVSEADSFPTDLYIMEGVASTRQNMQRRLLGTDGNSLAELLDDQVAVVSLSHVNYRTGELLPIAELVKQTHAAGALFVLDTCHSAGILPVELDRWGVDFAVGCTYKYLNGGPGSPAFIYVAKQHQQEAVNPLSGWWGHARPFAFEENYQAAEGILRFRTGTQPILAFRGLQAGLEIAQEADIHQVRIKSQRLTQLFIELVKMRCGNFGITLQSPTDPEKRGSQVALHCLNGFAVIQALSARKIIADFRAPGTMRFGFAPLYLRYTDVWDAAEALFEVLETEEWRKECFQQKAAVT